jgi:hypothetical protein
MIPLFLWIVLEVAPGCATTMAPRPEARLSFPAGSDRHLRASAEIEADQIEVVLPAIYRGACSVTCDPATQQRRITPSLIELIDLSGTGFPPLVLQVAELRLLGRQRIRAHFDDALVRETGVLVNLSAKGAVAYRGPAGRRTGETLFIRNHELVVNE